MKKPLLYIFSALNSKSGKGASARKLSSFVVMVCIIVGHISYFRHSFLTDTDYELLPEMLIIDFSFISVALGMVTAQEIIHLKTGKKDENNKEI